MGKQNSICPTTGRSWVRILVMWLPRMATSSREPVLLERRLTLSTIRSSELMQYERGRIELSLRRAMSKQFCWASSFAVNTFVTFKYTNVPLLLTYICHSEIYFVTKCEKYCIFKVMTQNTNHSTILFFKMWWLAWLPHSKLVPVSNLLISLSVGNLHVHSPKT